MNSFTNALLRYLTPAQLALIQSKKIGIGGAGGLGSNVAMILTRTGFSNFEIIDKDTVEASNLNRQDYTLADIGLPKVAALKKRMLSVNPDALIITHHQSWDETAPQELFQGCAMIVEAFDKAEWKTRFVDFYHDRAPYIVSGNGMAGFKTTTALTTRRVGNIYFIGDAATGIEDGHPPLAPRVMECAAKMANIILQLSCP
ncbi:MAG: sulfur carrier protein ThiS adenylyltransferase ThiF [Candidatus Omnitrophica bacterium]|nr:sulfur carrier protein ThiS adenylyltransferase ThiF [Candidatus Omnitrophota bacterium]